MKVLGISSLTHDVGAAVCIDGKIVSALEEERLSRIKHHPGIEIEGKPPRDSVQYVLKEAGLSLADIDKIVHVGSKGNDFMRLDIIGKRFREFAKELDYDDKKTIFIGHHLAHAASAFYSSGFDDAIVASIDGAGDWISSSLWLGEQNKLRKLDEYYQDNSLGFMFTRAAKTIGLGGFGYGEGKLTALAAYGVPIDNFPEIIVFENGRYSLMENYYELFKEFKRNKNEPIDDLHKNFAATIQMQLENAVGKIISIANKKYNKNKLAIAGGVALNCKMNGELSKLPWVQEMYIQPGANDSGLCIGAAYVGAVKLGDTPKKLSSIYLGPDIIDNDVVQYIKNNKLRAEFTDKPYSLAAKFISHNMAVAWVQGKLEFGPRALGHRSLLGDPRYISSRDSLNKIKQREPWRPVAPAIIDSDKNYFDNSQATEHMTKAIDSTQTARKEIPGGIHVDGTARVQLVKNKEDSFYKLIKEFENITGIPGVLNTSLNSRNEPLCTTIDDAVKFFYTTPTDKLIIGNWSLSKGEYDA